MRIPIVDEEDKIIGYKERDDKDIHTIYRVSYLWITDTDGRILLAQRALDKKHDPGKWGPAVAGTVEEGETYESNIIKEAEEEIGLKNIKPVLGIKRRQQNKYNYFTQEFLLTLPSGFNDFKVQKEEVSEIKWFTVEGLKEKLKESPEDFLSVVSVKLNNL